MPSPLDILLSDGVIDEILGRLKSGKEADIYMVRHRGQVVAAKVYKDRDQRSFKHNADYKEGRAMRSSRTRRAVEKGSRFGQQAAEQAWKSAESDALHLLHGSGVRVPEPVMFYEGILLMQLVTDAEGRPAQRLIDTASLPAPAAEIYRDLRAQMVRMLCCEIIHGDLSAYNVLAAAGGPTIIDFPQIVSAAHSSRSEFFFQRDFRNVLEFLAGADRALLAYGGDGRKIWNAYMRRELWPDFIPSPPQAGDERDRRQHHAPRGQSQGQRPRQGGGPPRPQGGPPRQQQGGPRPPRPQGGPPRQGSGPPRPHSGPPRPQGGPPPARPGGPPSAGAGRRRRRRRRY